VLPVMYELNSHVLSRQIKILSSAHQDFQPSLYIQLYRYNKILQATNRSHTNYDIELVRSVGQSEARHRKYKRLKLGDGQAYDRSK
jgi:hypothetical protein